jgi:regulatory protein
VRTIGSPPALPESADAAEDAALRILRGAGQSGTSLRRKLEQRGYAAEAAAEAVQRCIATGYVNDAAMAASVAARHRRAGHGRARVAADLKSKGVAAELITEALDGQSDSEEAAALAVARQLWERAGAVDARDRRAYMRVAGALQRRGFSSSVVSRVMRGLS